MFQDWARSTGPKLWTYHIPQWEWFWMTLTLQQCLGTISETTGWCESKSCQRAWKVMNENRMKEFDPLGFLFFFLIWVYFHSLIRTYERRETTEKKRITWKFHISIFALLYQKKIKSIWHPSVHITPVQCTKLIHQSFEIFISCLWDFLSKNTKKL